MLQIKISNQGEFLMHAPNCIDLRNTDAMLEYELLTTHVDDFEQMSYTTYGICVRDGHGTVVLNHEDISTSREYVQGFIDFVKEHDISPVHIGDVLEDYLD